VSPFFTVVFATMYRVLNRPATIVFDNHYDIGVSRSKVVEAFLATDCEKLVIIDTDIVPYKCTEKGELLECSVYYNALNELLDKYTNYDVVSVYHWSKKFEPNAYRIKSVEKLGEDIYIVDYEPLYLKPNTGVHQIDFAGMSITMIDRRVLEAIGFPWFRVVYTRLPDGRKYEMGEDVYFYMKLREKGFKAYVTTDIVALHLGEFALDLYNRVRHIAFTWYEHKNIFASRTSSVISSL
jgi:Tfp pilus assembly protein PilZ